MVLTYRSDDRAADRLGPYLAQLDRNPAVERMELPRFRRQEVVDQLAEILQAAPTPKLVDAIFARAQGNPFFTEELLAAARHGSQQLPTTLRDLLRGRLEALSGQAQHVLAVAAVAGRRIPHWLLAASANMGEPQLEDALREAVDGRLLMTQPGEDGYEFRHASDRKSVV